MLTIVSIGSRLPVPSRRGVDRESLPWKEEEEEAVIPGLEFVPASGCEDEPSTLEYISPLVSQAGPLPVSVRIPTARVFHHHPTPYPVLNCIPSAYRVRSPPHNRSDRGLSGHSELAGSGDCQDISICVVIGPIVTLRFL